MHDPATHISKLDAQLSEFYSRYEGDVDEFGFNPKTVAQWRPFFQFFYEDYFQVEATGIENIPKQGRAVLIGNHGGVLPMDAFMICTAVLLHHEAPRRIRFLSHGFLRSNRWLYEIVSGHGGVPATYAVAKTLLKADELVFFYPEGPRGTGKRFSMRNRVYDFDPGFVKAAIATSSPIIPVVTLGSDEIYPMLANFKSVARLMRTPYWPVTPMFPWLPFFSSCVPLPIKFLISIGKPIYLDYPPDRVSDRKLRLEIAREIQYDVQRELNKLLRQRKSLFAGW